MGDDPFKVIKKINDNAYRVDMPQDYWGNNSFNVVNLTSFNVGTQTPNLRSNFLQEGKNDMNMTGKGQNLHGSLKNIKTIAWKE
ncbi:hypothetical protein CR513_10719, partial [Mucuna pruriens]